MQSAHSSSFIGLHATPLCQDSNLPGTGSVTGDSRKQTAQAPNSHLIQQYHIINVSIYVCLQGFARCRGLHTRHECPSTVQQSTTTLVSVHTGDMYQMFTHSYDNLDACRSSSMPCSQTNPSARTAADVVHMHTSKALEPLRYTCETETSNLTVHMHGHLIRPRHLVLLLAPHAVQWRRMTAYHMQSIVNCCHLSCIPYAVAAVTADASPSPTPASNFGFIRNSWQSLQDNQRPEALTRSGHGQAPWKQAHIRTKHKHKRQTGTHTHQECKAHVHGPAGA